jgi:hypothetical protein
MGWSGDLSGEIIVSRLEAIVIGIVLGLMAPVSLFLAGWWLSISLVAEQDIWKIAVGGLLAGIVVDVFVLRGWVRRAYALSTHGLVAVYLFYTVGIFGFFMGVPVFNLLPGVAAGLYVGRRLRFEKADSGEFRRRIGRAARFTAWVMFFVCASSGVLALLNPSTGFDLGRMLHLGFQVTRPMIVGLVFVGGLGLIAGQFHMTRLSGWLAFDGAQREAPM